MASEASRAARRLAYKRGYMAITIRDRGPVKRGRRRAFGNASKLAWATTAEYFHEHLRDRRFTPEHAQAAGYARRKGELQPAGSKSFRRSYTGRKQKRFGHTNPLQFTGETRRRIASEFNITSTKKGGKIAYRGASKFSFRHPRSRVRMNEEFRRLIPSEIETLADVFDAALDDELAKLSG